MQHSLYGGSNSHRWLNCPGSIKLTQEIIGTESHFETSMYATEGSVAHYVASWMLKNSGLSFPESEMKDYVLEYVNYVKMYVLDSKKLHIEKTISWDHVIPHSFGTPDAVYEGNSTVHIFDFKYGMGIKIPAIENHQLITYAVPYLQSNMTYYLHIIQPRLNHYDIWEVSSDDIENHAARMKSAYSKSISKDPPLSANPKWCKFCPAIHRCSAVKEYAFENIPDVSLSITKKEMTILKNKDLIFEYLRRLEEKIITHMQLGGRIDGVHLGKKRSFMKYTGDAEMVLKKELGENAYAKKLKPIGKIKDLVPKELLDKITFKHSGGHKINFTPGEIDVNPEYVLEGGINE